MIGTSERAIPAQNREKERLRHERRQANRRHQRLMDAVLLALALLTVSVLALALFGQQQKFNRLSNELAQLKVQSQPGAANSTVDGALSMAAARVAKAGTLAFPMAGIEQAAAQAGDCPRAAAAQLTFKKQFLAPINYWSQTELKELRGQQVTYLFSGPDVATAATLFGATDHLVMMADQWVEQLDDAASTPARQQAECKTLAHYSRYGYFRTNDLEGLGGVRPRFLHLLMHNILLADLSIDSAQYLAINAEGQAHPVRPETGSKAAGVRFHVRRHDGSTALIDYMRVDLSDAYLKKSPAELAYLRQRLSHVVLLKSASHLLQEPMFSTTAGLVSQYARSVVQDETGMHIGALQQNFDLRLYGDFADAHRLWAGKAAVKELRAFRASVGEAEPLYFTFGYEKPMGSLILVGTRRKDPLKLALAP